MTDEQRAEFRRRYEAEAHAVQSGVSYLAHHRPSMYEPKHTRTGLNCVMRDLSSLARLMIAKGVITEEEYCEALIVGLREEKESITRELEALYGTKVTLA